MPFHPHIPKPLHGWRAFGGEVGVIVLGVLIALAAEQGAETLHWHQQVGQAREALGFEIADSIGQSYERDKFSPCLDRKLDQIALILDGAIKSGRLPPVGRIGGPPYRTWLTNVWSTTTAGQIASHFSRYDLSQYGNFYEFVRHAGEDSRKELADWSMLQTIVGPGRPVTPDETALLLRATEDARNSNRLVEVSGVRMREVAARAKVPYDQPTVDAYRHSFKAVIATCREIPAEPAPHYGLSPFSSAVSDLSKKDPLSMR